MKKALVTGGNGNIGRLLSERLVAKNIDVIRFDIPGSEPENHDPLETILTGDVRDLSLLESIFQTHKPFGDMLSPFTQQEIAQERQLPCTQYTFFDQCMFRRPSEDSLGF